MHIAKNENNYVAKHHGLRQILQVVLEIILIGGLAYYLYRHGEEFKRVLNVRVADVAYLLGLIVIGNLIRSSELKQYVRALGANNIPYRQSVWLTVGCTLLNYLPMNIGMIVKARGLKKHLGIRYARFVSLSSADILITVIAGAAIGLFVLIMSQNMVEPDRWYVAFVFLIMLIFAGLVFKIPSSWIAEDKGWILHTLRDYLSGVELIKANPAILATLFLFVTARLLFIGVQFWICFSALGTTITFIGGVFFAVVTSLLMIVNITPAGLGVRELLVGIIAAVTGQSFEVGVLAAGLYRVCGMIVHVSIGVPGLIALRMHNVI